MKVGDAAVAWLKGRGATCADYAGVNVAINFGDPAAEWAAIEGAAAVVDLCFRRVLYATGAESGDYLQGRISNNVGALKVGQGSAATVLNAQGRALALLAVYADQDRYVLVCDADQSEVAHQALEAFLVADDCEFEPARPVRVFGVMGPQALSLMNGLGFGSVASAGAWAMQAGEIQGCHVSVLSRGDLRVPAFEVYVDSDGYAEAVWNALVAAGAYPAGVDAFECLRVTSGTPRYGVDIDATRVALEARLEWAMHFDKGCYVGQEVIERATSRGRVNRLLCLAGPRRRPGSAIALSKVTMPSV